MSGEKKDSTGWFFLLVSEFSLILFLFYALSVEPGKPGKMHQAASRCNVSLCPEGCIHLMVGRAIIKMTQEEFFSLANLTDKAAQEMRFLGPVHPPVSGH